MPSWSGAWPQRHSTSSSIQIGPNDQARVWLNSLLAMLQDLKNALSKNQASDGNELDDLADLIPEDLWQELTEHMQKLRSATDR